MAALKLTTSGCRKQRKTFRASATKRWPKEETRRTTWTRTKTTKTKKKKKKKKKKKHNHPKHKHDNIVDNGCFGLWVRPVVVHKQTPYP